MVDLFSAQRIITVTFSSETDRIRRKSGEAYEVAQRWWQIFPKRIDSNGIPAEPKVEELDVILFDPKTGEVHGRLELLRARLLRIIGQPKQFIHLDISDSRYHLRYPEI